MLTSGFPSKVWAAGRLVALSAVGGALVAGLALPAVGAAGIALRNEATKFNNMPTPELGQLPVRSEILDRNGQVLAYLYPHSLYRVPVSFSQIAPVMRQAIVAIEDSRFYSHGAIDFKGTLRALVNDLEHKPIQGGSTLTQQYVKNVEILSSPNPVAAFQNATADTIARKLRELRMAVRVEHTMSKDQILAGYLNVAYFGGQALGVQVAARRYFSTSASRLTLTQAATLAGIVEDPAQYDPIVNPQSALTRRNTVLARMAQVGDITQAQAQAAIKKPLGLKLSAQQSGCTSGTAEYAGYFCAYVLAVLQHDAAYQQVWSQLNGAGGLKIYTTLDPQAQRTANHAVDYVMPAPPSHINPGRNADTEVLLQPGTGQIRAIAINRPYGFGRNQNSLDYAVGPQYGGGEGVQIGSSGKVYTLVTALEQGIPFGYTKHVNGTAHNLAYTNCQGQPVMWPHVTNDQSELTPMTYSLYTGTTASINVFYAYLEQKIGLCNVVKTAAKMGLTWPDGTSLLQKNPQTGRPAADNDPSFTLGADNVAPIDVAAADASLPARGIYCHPIAITKIENASGASLPVESAGCHRVMPATIADAANYILQGDLRPGGTAPSDAIGIPAASKTGTADSYTSAFFVGYTPGLIATDWVGNPAVPTPMVNYPSGCYRAGCFPFMYGSMAPGATWQMTFQHLRLPTPPLNFVPVPASSPLFSKGTGQVVAQPKPKPHGGGGGHGGGGPGGGGPGHGGGTPTNGG